MFLQLSVVSIFLGSIGAWVVAKFGSLFGLIDLPTARSSHCKPTPKGGGIGILIVFILAGIFLRLPAAFWLSGAWIGLWGLAGDRMQLSPAARLVMHFAAALVFVKYILAADQLSHPIITVIPLSVFIVGTANFYNFMDGIDGIAAVSGAVAFFLLAGFCSYAGNGPEYVQLSLCLACSCIGFLWFNIPTARVFMGDVGSLLLGFVFACVVAAVSENTVDFLCLASFLCPFYADGLTTMAVRLSHGENLLHPHRQHLYQLLANELAMDHWKISLSYGCLQFMIGIVMLMARKHGLGPVIFLWLAFFVTFAGVSIHVRQFEGCSR